MATQAREALHAAVQADVSGDYTNAYAHYKQGISLLMDGLSKVPDPSNRQKLQEKIGQYMSRAQAIKDVLDMDAKVESETQEPSNSDVPSPSSLAPATPSPPSNPPSQRINGANQEMHSLREVSGDSSPQSSVAAVDDSLSEYSSASLEGSEELISAYSCVLRHPLNGGMFAGRLFLYPTLLGFAGQSVSPQESKRSANTAPRFWLELKYTSMIFINASNDDNNSDNVIQFGAETSDGSEWVDSSLKGSSDDVGPSLQYQLEQFDSKITASIVINSIRQIAGHVLEQKRKELQQQKSQNGPPLEMKKGNGNINNYNRTTVHVTQNPKNGSTDCMSGMIDSDNHEWWAVLMRVYGRVGLEEERTAQIEEAKREHIESSKPKTWQGNPLGWWQLYWVSARQEQEEKQRELERQQRQQHWQQQQRYARQHLQQSISNNNRGGQVGRSGPGGPSLPMRPNKNKNVNGGTPINGSWVVVSTKKSDRQQGKPKPPPPQHPSPSATSARQHLQHVQQNQRQTAASSSPSTPQQAYHTSHNSDISQVPPTYAYQNMRQQQHPTR